MMKVLKYDKCANCGACYNYCPTKAISVKKNKMHYILTVDEKKCVQCGICLSICPVNTTVDNMKPLSAYGLWNKNPEIVMQSSSGGVFYGLAKKVLEDKGVVYGAAFSEDYKSVAIRSTDEVSIFELMKSKYVESLVDNSFQEAEKKLRQGKMVLFSGTPCQIHGLKRFLKKDYDNLICCDFACGGLPSHKMYHEHLDSLEKKYNSKIQCVDFRPKTHGWSRYAIWVQFENGKIYNRLASLDEYYRAFLYGKYSIREYCMDCSFSENHVADITMADFWKYDTISSLRNESGISLVLCNTTKGKKALESIKNEYEIEELDIEAASYNLRKEELKENHKKRRKKFYDDYLEVGLYKAVRLNIGLSIKQRLKFEISNIINRRSRWDRKNLES